MKNPTASDRLVRYVAHCIERGVQLQIASLRNHVIATRRPNRNHPAEVTLQLPDALVKALRGAPADGPEIVIAVVPREICNEVDHRIERAKSPIILPGDGR